MWYACVVAFTMWTRNSHTAGLQVEYLLVLDTPIPHKHQRVRPRNTSLGIVLVGRRVDGQADGICVCVCLIELPVNQGGFLHCVCVCVCVSLSTAYGCLPVFAFVVFTERWRFLFFDRDSEGECTVL